MKKMHEEKKIIPNRELNLSMSTYETNLKILYLQLVEKEKKIIFV